MSAAETMSGAPVPTVGDKAFALDASVIGAVSVLICVAADRLALMSAAIPALLCLRLLLWNRLGAQERGHGLATELIFFTLCTFIGAANDFNSVVRHQIYDYTVPHYFAWSTIPLWMLLYWGMILRFLVTLFRYRRLGPPPHLRNRVALGPWRTDNAAVKVILQLAIVVVTRQLIYRFYLDPFLSWAPFAVAIIAALLLFGADRHDRRILPLFAVGGAAVEVLYIQMGGLHAYHLGWLGGVPLWIALWWVLAAMIWHDLAARMLVALENRRRIPRLAPAAR